MRQSLLAPTPCFCRLRPRRRAAHRLMTIATGEDTPVAVSLAPDQLLAPYYAELRKKVTMPEAGPNPGAGAFDHADPHRVRQLQPPVRPAAYGGADFAAQNPQLFLMIGDNVYGDNGWDADAGLESLRKILCLAGLAPLNLRAFAQGSPMMGDLGTRGGGHDYGLNDAGASFPMRRWGEELFETFWGSSRRGACAPRSLMTAPSHRAGRPPRAR